MSSKRRESSAVPATPEELSITVVSATRSDSALVDQDWTTFLNKIAIATRAIGIARRISPMRFPTLSVARFQLGGGRAPVCVPSLGERYWTTKRSAIGRRYFRPASAMRGKFSDHLPYRWNGGSSGSVPKVRVC